MGRVARGKPSFHNAAGFIYISYLFIRNSIRVYVDYIRKHTRTYGSQQAPFFQFLPRSARREECSKRKTFSSHTLQYSALFFRLRVYLRRR